MIFLVGNKAGDVPQFTGLTPRMTELTRASCPKLIAVTGKTFFVTCTVVAWNTIRVLAGCC
jgi:hypothetical protein